MTRLQIPTVRVENVEVDQASDRLTSLIVVVDYSPGLARIELKASSDLPFASVGYDAAARLELHRLIHALETWASATARFAPPAPKEQRLQDEG
ncbi:MAG: hypothetical protein ACKVP3_27020 [Hyphomicrobiaceae bacterium]